MGKTWKRWFKWVKPKRGRPEPTMSLYIERSKYPISDDWTERNLLKRYTIWPSGRRWPSLFDEQYLGKTRDEKPLPVSVLRRKKNKDYKRKLPEAVRLYKGRPLDGRESMMGPRKINLTEHVAADLARHIKACGNAKDLPRGRYLEGYVLNSDFKDSRYLANLLVEMYGKCGCIDEAFGVFGKIQDPNVFSYNMIIAALVHNDRVEEGRSFFDDMGERDMVTWNTMVTAYAQSGHLEEAKFLFDRMPFRGVVSWTAMISAYAESSQLDRGRSLFDEMPDRNVVSWNAMLQAYAKLGQMQEANDLFSLMPEKDVLSWTAMVTAFGNNQRLESARLVFDRMPKRDTASWNVMIDAYALNRQPNEARRMFERMPCPDHFSWPSLIRAYAICGYLTEARIVYKRCPRKMMYTWSALVCAYAINGRLDRARDMFERMPSKNAKVYNCLIASYIQNGDLDSAEGMFRGMWSPTVNTWNAMIHAYARCGQHESAAQLVLEMNLFGQMPDDVTFVGLLNSCNHKGSPAVAREFFLAIQAEHFLEPTVDHYCCMINVLGRAGKLSLAEELITHMPFLPDAVTWTTLLGICKLHGDVELGTVAAKHLFELDPQCPSPYLLLADLETPPVADNYSFSDLLQKSPFSYKDQQTEMAKS